MDPELARAADGINAEIRAAKEALAAMNRGLDRLESTMREGFAELKAINRKNYENLDRRLRALET